MKGHLLRIGRIIGTVVGTTLLMTVAAPLTPAVARPDSPAQQTADAGHLDRATLDATLRAIHDAGMYYLVEPDGITRTALPSKSKIAHGQAA